MTSSGVARLQRAGAMCEMVFSTKRDTVCEAGAAERGQKSQAFRPYRPHECDDEDRVQGTYRLVARPSERD
jgi:mannose-6-phosphate isomerase-like protein (cupin superfamily)